MFATMPGRTDIPVALNQQLTLHGDPNLTHYRKNVFDMGEYGIGVLANSLELGGHGRQLRVRLFLVPLPGRHDRVRGQADGPDNPHGNAWVVRQTPLARESEAQRLADGRTARYWRIINPTMPNGVGEPVAYKLVPQGDSVLPFNQPDSHVIRRAQFADGFFDGNPALDLPPAEHCHHEH